jgi:DNA polymerase-3 subunit gamma/tau
VTYSGERIETGDVLAVLGVADADLLFGALDAVAAGDARGALHAAARIAATGRDLAQACRDLEVHARELLVVQTLGAVPASLRVTPDRDERLAAQAAAVPGSSVVRLLDLLAGAMRAMKDGADPRTQLELALVKAAAPEVDPSARALQARLERLEAALAARPAAATAPQTPAARAAATAPDTPATPAVAPVSRVASPEPTASDDGWEPAGGPPASEWDEPAPATAPATSAAVAPARATPPAPATPVATAPPTAPTAPAPAAAAPAAPAATAPSATAVAPPPAAPPAAAPPTAVAPPPAAPPAALAPSATAAPPTADLSAITAVWPAVLTSLREDNGMLGAALAEGVPTAVRGTELLVAFPAAQAFQRRMCETGAHKELIAAAVRTHTGGAWKVAFDCREDVTPAAEAEPPTEDELIARLQAAFDAEELLPDDAEEA